MAIATPATEGASGIRSRTIADLLPAACRAFATREALRFKDGSGTWQSQSYAELETVVRRLSLGLVDLGIEAGDRVAILANTRVEWTWFDFAALTAGATVVPIYQTNSPEECQYVLENSDAKAVIVEDDEQLEKIRAVRDRCPELEHVILMTGTAADATSFEEIAARGDDRPAAEWEERYGSIGPDDICTFIYTSGTTGPPKGCVITHRNAAAVCSIVRELDLLSEEGDEAYLYLPLAHVFAMITQLGAIEVGAAISFFGGDTRRIIEELGEARPTYLPSVPRIFEKLYTMATVQLEMRANIKLLHVPYRGLAPAINDIIAGHVDLMFDTPTTSLPLHRDGKIRIVALNHSQRVDDSCRDRRAFVNNGRALRAETGIHGRAVVEEGDLVRNVDRTRGDGVAVAVGRRDRHRNGIVTQAERIVRVRVDRVIERQILLERNHAGRRIDRNRERGLAVEATAIDHADDDAADQLELDRRAVRQGYA